MDANDNKKEPTKSLCNNCLSKVTGIEDKRLTEDDGSELGFDLGDVFRHMHWSISKTNEHIFNNHKAMSTLYLSYLENDLELLKSILGYEDVPSCGHLDDHSHDDMNEDFEDDDEESEEE